MLAVYGELDARVNASMPAAVAALEAAGKKPGQDVIVVSIDGKPVANSRDALNRIAGRAPGSVVTLKVIRQGKPFSVKVTITERPVQRNS